MFNKIFTSVCNIAVMHDYMWYRSFLIIYGILKLKSAWYRYKGVYSN